MLRQPILHTRRLLLRSFTPADAPDVQRLASAIEIASTTASIPHPYEDGMAEKWIAGHKAALEGETEVTYAVIDSETGELAGAIGLSLIMEHRRAELGYWIGVPYWGRGFGTEAANAVLRFAFEDLGLHRVLARHFLRNPASGRVLQKIGMRQEGLMRQHFLKWGKYEDVVIYGILGVEWAAISGADVLGMA